MTAVVLFVIAGAQLAFAAVVITLLVLYRAQGGTRAASRREASARVAEPVRRWLLGEGSSAEVAAALRPLPVHSAIEHATALAGQRAPAERMRDLAVTLRGEPWVRAALRGAGSRFWWRRLDAARALSIVGGPADAALLRRMLDDPRPAVQAVATRSIAAVADAALVRHVVDTLPRRTNVVRLWQSRALRERWPEAAPALLAHLADPRATDAALRAWVGLAGMLEVPAALAACVPHRAHDDVNVRIAVARVLRSYYHPDGERALVELLTDADWRVRGQAARSLGALGAESAVAALGEAMRDPAWWVRFRAGLALAQLGARGRQALRELRQNSDRYGREMAWMISGLSEGSLTELAEQ